MTIALVAAASAVGTNSGSGVNTTGANLLLGVNSSYSALPTSGDVSDNKSNSYTWIATANQIGGQPTNGDLYYNVGGTVGVGHVWDITAGSFQSAGGAAFSGVSASSPLNGSDVTAVSQGTAIALTVGPITPSAPGCLLVASFAIYGNGATSAALDSASVSAGWQVATYLAPTAGSLGILIAYLIQTTATSASCGIVCGGTSTTDMAAIMQAFNPAGGGGSPTFSISGVGTPIFISASTLGISGSGVFSPKTASLLAISGTGTLRPLSASKFSIAGSGTFSPEMAAQFGITGAGTFSPIPGSAFPNFAITGAAAASFRSASAFSVVGQGQFNPISQAIAATFSITGAASFSFIPGTPFGWIPATVTPVTWTPQVPASSPWTPVQ